MPPGKSDDSDCPQRIWSLSNGWNLGKDRFVDVTALIMAAGRGTRAGSSAALPKQYAPLQGRSMLNHSVAAFAQHPSVVEVMVVIDAADQELYSESVAQADPPKCLKPPTVGGASRQESVHAGLERLAEGTPPAAVLIHDAARPFVDREVISRVTDGLDSTDGVIAALPVLDTVQRTDSSGRISETIPRDGLWRAQTPQGFAFQPLLEAHRKAAQSGLNTFTDDAALFTWAGGRVDVVSGAEHNKKITTAEDLAVAQQGTAGRWLTRPYRLGI